VIYVFSFRKYRSLWESAFFAFLIRVDVESSQIKTFENSYARSSFDRWLTSLKKTRLEDIKNDAWLYRITVVNESSLTLARSERSRFSSVWVLRMNFAYEFSAVWDLSCMRSQLYESFSCMKFAYGFCVWVLRMNFAYEFCVWVLRMSFHLWVSSVNFHQWIFICEFSSVSFHLWIFICWDFSFTKRCFLHSKLRLMKVDA
jgi:hypothetical protein